MKRPPTPLLRGVASRFCTRVRTAAVALATGTVRRAALDAALDQIDRGALYPSFEWRRDYALVLGLERVLSESQPKLASGTTLRRHQVDALAGQLAAADRRPPARRARGERATTRRTTTRRPARSSLVAEVEVDDEDDEDDEDEDDEEYDDEDEAEEQDAPRPMRPAFS